MTWVDKVPIEDGYYWVKPKSNIESVHLIYLTSGYQHRRIILMCGIEYEYLASDFLFSPRIETPK